MSQTPARKCVFMIALCGVAIATAFVPAPAFGQSMQGPQGGHNAMASSQVKPPLLKDVGIDQKMGGQVPADLVFRDESGRDVRLGDYFGKRPVILSLVYFDCPMLCTVVLNELEKTLKLLSITPGEEYEVLTVSFDPRETPSLASAKKDAQLKRLNRPGAENGWHFLTGDAAPIKALTESVGFRYAWDEANKQYVHSSGLVVLTPDGRISRYFFGVDYAPTDVRFALQEASGNKIGTVADRALLYCFTYNPASGKYGLAISRALKVGGALTLGSLLTFMVVSLRRERLKAAGEAAESAGPAGGEPPARPADDND